MQETAYGPVLSILFFGSSLRSKLYRKIPRNCPTKS